MSRNFLGRFAFPALLSAAGGVAFTPALSGAQANGTALVRHAPSLNGNVEGSVQQMLPESVTLNGSARVIGDLLVPGTPTIRLNGSPSFGGTADLDGSASPSNFQVTLNGSVSLRYVFRRVDAIPLPVVAAPPLPAGTRNVTINAAGQSVGAWNTVRNLTLNGGVGNYNVPPGTYGDFIANGGGSFTLGVAGATVPAAYNFQRLTLNGNSQLRVVGPVIVTVKNGGTVNGNAGIASNPAWLALRFSTGGLTLNGGVKVYGYVDAPSGTVIINGNSLLEGGITCDRLTINGGGILRLIDATPTDLAPVANPQSLQTFRDSQLPLVLTGSDPENAPLSFSVRTAPAHGSLAGASGLLTTFPTPSFSSGSLVYSPIAGYTGTDAFTFSVSDGTLSSAPVTIGITVAVPPQPPEGASDNYALNEGETISVPAPGVLSNDLNPSGGSLSAQLVNPALFGAVTLNSSGAFGYTPGNGFYGTDSFLYRPVSSGIQGSATTVSLNVNARPRPAANTVNTPQNVPVDVPLLATDPDDTVLTYTILTLPASGVLQGNVTTGLRYVPNFQFSGQDSLTFRVIDPDGASAIGTVSIVVASRNIAPVARFSFATSAVVAPFAVNFDGAASYDLDGSIVRYQWDFDGDGVYDAEGPTPQHTFSEGGFEPVRLTVTDDDGGTGTTTESVQLNLAPVVTINRPTALAAFAQGVPVPVEVSAADEDGTITRVELSVDGSLVGVVASAWGQFTLEQLSEGEHLIEARAFDDDGAQAAALPVAIRIDVPLSASGKFVVHPTLRVATLASVPGLAQGGAGQENTTTLPLFADNFFPSPVAYTATAIDNAVGGETEYLVQDSATSTEVAYAWQEVALTGTKLGVSQVDDGFTEVPLSFAFPFYDQNFTQVFVGSNGLLTLQQGSSRADNEDIPAPSAPQFLIAPYWTDLLPGLELDSGGYSGVTNASAIYAQDFGDRLVVEYAADTDYWGEAPDPENNPAQGVPHFTHNGRYTFQVVLHANGDIDLVYRVMLGRSDLATIGIQNGEGTDGVRLAFNQAFLTDHRLIRLKRQSSLADWFAVDPAAGVLATGERDELTIHYFSRPDFPIGEYRGQIRVDHNQPGLAPYFVDVGLEVYSRDPAVSFVNPLAGARRYFLLGETIPVELEAHDDDGVVRSVQLSVDGAPASTWLHGPFLYGWQPAVGLHHLAAFATDNDGRVGEAEPVEVSISADTDADGLPDAWELVHFGSLDFGALDDPDGDGRTNRKEFYFGSAPNLGDIGAGLNVPPVPRISSTRLSGEAPFIVHFDGTSSTDHDGAVVVWTWEVSGATTTDPNEPQIHATFATAGTYAVRLTVFDDQGAAASTTVNVRVRPGGTAQPPAAAFEASTYAAEAARMIAFDAGASSDPDGVIQTYIWDFGDGASAFGLTTAHYFERVGIFPVRLTVTDDDGLAASRTKYITITDRDQGIFAETDNGLVMEAEHATTFDQHADVNAWRLERAGFTQGDWGAELDGDPSMEQMPIAWDDAAEIAWRVHITHPGLYYYAVRYTTSGRVAWGPLALRVGVDGVETSPPEGDPWGRYDAGIQWRRGVPLGFLSAGVHTIQLKRHTERLWIDQIVIALDKESLPADRSKGAGLVPSLRPNLPRAGPVANIATTVISSALPFVATLDASSSLSARGAITGFNWFVDRTVDPADGTVFQQRPAVATGATFALELDDFNPPAVGGFGSDGVDVRLRVVDDAGHLAESRTHIVPVDPLETASGAGEVVVDDDSAGFSAGANWRVSQAACDFVDGGFFPGGVAEYAALFHPPAGTLVFVDRLELRDWLGPNARFHFSGGAADAARFMPELPAADDYLVFAHWPRNDQPLAESFVHPIAESAVVTVQAASGERTYRVDQRVGGGHWRFLGVHHFEAGTAGSVTIGGSADGELVFADAVRFVRVPPAGANAPPVAQMAATVRGDRSVAFDGSSSHDAQGPILAWFWEFGDGRTSRAIHPLHRYSAPGAYTVALTVLDSALASHTTTQTISVAANNVGERPVARLRLNALRGTVPFTVQGDASPSSDDGTIVSFQWEAPLRDKPWRNHGDFFALADHAAFTFNAPGVYPVTLTVTDDQRERDVATVWVEALSAGESIATPFVVDDRDHAAGFTGAWTRADDGLPFGPDYAAATQVGDAVVFRPTLPQGGLYQVSMRFPLSVPDPALGVTVQHVGGVSRTVHNASLEPGQWHLLGTFLFSAGTQGSVSFARERSTQTVFADAVRWVPVGAGTHAAFALSFAGATIAPATIEVDAASSSADAAIIAYTWEFGDGTAAQGVTATHTYSTAGIYVVALTVTDALGATSTLARFVIVEPPVTPPVPVAFVSPLTGSAPLSIAFDGSTSSDADGIAHYAWDLGDGRQFSGPVGMHRFDRPGSYVVTLVVTDLRGASATSTVNVQVGTVPVLLRPAIHVTPSVPVQGRVQFDAGGEVAGATFLWDFGDGQTSDQSTPVHDFVAPGAYQVHLTVMRDGVTEVLDRWIVIGSPGTPSQPPDAPRSDPGAAFQLYTPFSTP